jgi:threonine synthase
MARIVALYGGEMTEKGKVVRQPDMDNLKKDMFAVSIGDAETRETISRIYERHKVVLEPHGAVGWAGLRHYFQQFPEDHNSNQVSVCFETAHPAKFPKEILEILKFDPELPESLKGLENKPEKFQRISNDYNSFKKYLTKNFK